MICFTYITEFVDIRSDRTDTLIHHDDSLPSAIKEGRRYVTDLNRQIGRKVYFYVRTYRKRK